MLHVPKLKQLQRIESPTLRGWSHSVSCMPAPSFLLLLILCPKLAQLWFRTQIHHHAMPCADLRRNPDKKDGVASYPWPARIGTARDRAPCSSEYMRVSPFCLFFALGKHRIKSLPAPDRPHGQPLTNRLRQQRLCIQKKNQTVNEDKTGQETRNSTRTEGVSIGLTSAEMLAGCQLPPIAGTAKSKANRLWAPWISLPKPQAGGDGTEALKHAPNKFQACVLSPRVRDAVSTTGCLVVC